MAGVLVPVAEHLPRNGNGPFISQFENSGEWGLSDAVAADAGAATINLPIDVESRTVDGVQLYGFADDFYNAIYFIPDPVVFTSIDRDTQTSFFLWNAYLVEQELTEIDLVDFDGLTLQAPSLPTTFAPLALQEFVVEAADEGPVSFEASIIFSFTAIDDRTLTVSGSRAVPFFFKPNWRQPVTRRYEHQTIIGTSRNGREQRSSLRSLPRTTVSYTHNALNRAKTQEVMRRVAKDPHRPAAVPDWPSRVKIASAIAEGTASITLASTPRWVNANSRFFLVTPDHDRFQILEADTVVSNEITFVSPTEAFPAGSFLYHAFFARPNMPLDLGFLTSDISEVKFSFEVDPGDEDIATFGSAGDTYDGREVFTLRENWSGTPSIKYERDAERSDQGYGAVYVFSPKLFTRQIWTADYLSLSLDAAVSLENFWLRHAGRFKEFWKPTWQDDMSLRDQIGFNTNEVKVVGTEVDTAFGLDPTHRAIQIELNNGTIIRNRIVTMDSGTDTEGTYTRFVTLDDFSQQIDVEDVKRISWMHLCCFASDMLEMSYLTDGVAETSLSFETKYVEDSES